MGQNSKYMDGNNIGLGQMSEDACEDVDRIFQLGPGTCWNSQKSGDLCSQIANTEAYLAIRRAYYNTSGIRDALKGYGPGDASHGEYADPLLKCAKCMNDCAAKDPYAAMNPYGEGIVSNDDAQKCFDQLNRDVNDARKAAGKK